MIDIHWFEQTRWFEWQKQDIRYYLRHSTQYTRNVRKKKIPSSIDNYTHNRIETTRKKIHSYTLNVTDDVRKHHNFDWILLFFALASPTIIAYVCTPYCRGTRIQRTTIHTENSISDGKIDSWWKHTHTHSNAHRNQKSVFDFVYYSTRHLHKVCWLMLFIHINTINPIWWWWWWLLRINHLNPNWIQWTFLCHTYTPPKHQNQFINCLKCSLVLILIH